MDQYRSQMIPRAEKSYRLYLQEYNNMQGAYPQALIAQRTLFQLRIDYITALETLQMSSIALRGFMLTNASDAPASPGEINRPIRETNLPTRNIGEQR